MGVNLSGASPVYETETTQYETGPVILAWCQTLTLITKQTMRRENNCITTHETKTTDRIAKFRLKVRADHHDVTSMRNSAPSIAARNTAM